MRDAKYPLIEKKRYVIFVNLYKGPISDGMNMYE